MCAKARQHGSKKTGSTAELSGSAAEFDDLRVVVAGDQEKSQPQGRKKRGGRRRDVNDRGRPSEEGTRELARAYLEVQRRHWPEQIRKGLLPSPSDDVLNEMAAAFNRRFTDPNFLENLEVAEPGPTACCYSRFSSENSNPRSLAQQLRNELEKAAVIGHFVPWALVFADAAITGTTAARRGYEMAKLAMSAAHLSIAALYIDEIGRASRDMIEAMALGRSIAEDLGKRLIGASDGFDSNLPMYKFQLSMFAAMQEWFIDQLRSKVIRGQDDAFRRDSNTGLHAPGYSLAPMRDLQGREVLGGDGEQIKQEVIHEKRAKVIERIFTWFSIRRRSPEWISKRLNRMKFCGRVTWDGHRVRQILRRRTYVGIKTFRMTWQKRDRVTGSITVIKRPRKEWKVRRRRDLQIIPYSLWKKAKARLLEVREAYTKNLKSPPKRSTVYPTTLVRPVCDSCGHEMILGRSNKYASFVCHNGIHGKHGCAAKGYKCVEHVERTVLDEVLFRLGSPQMADQIVDRANCFLAEYSARPKTDSRSIDREIKSEIRTYDRLIRIVKGESSDDFGRVREEMRSIESKLVDLRAKKKSIAASNVEAPAPITRDQVLQQLNRLRDLLLKDVVSAAPLLRELTGPVRITQCPNKAKRGWEWTAHFMVDLVPVLAKIERQSSLPTTGIWEFLNTRGWTIQQRVVVKVDNPLAVDLLAQKIEELFGTEISGGPKMSVNAIAAALSVPWDLAKGALLRLESGVPLPTKVSKDRETPESAKKKTIDAPVRKMIERVIDLRDREKRTFPTIARVLGIKERKARGYYDLGHPEKVAAAVVARRCPDRGGYSHLGTYKYEEIRRLLSLGLKPAEVAKRANVGASTVYRESKRIIRVGNSETK